MTDRYTAGLAAAEAKCREMAAENDEAASRENRKHAKVKRLGDPFGDGDSYGISGDILSSCANELRAAADAIAALRPPPEDGEAVESELVQNLHKLERYLASVGEDEAVPIVAAARAAISAYTGKETDAP